MGYDIDKNKIDYACHELAVLEPGEAARAEYDTWRWGQNYYRLTEEHFRALREGKQIALSSMGEYIVFICAKDFYQGD